MKLKVLTVLAMLWMLPVSQGRADFINGGFDTDISAPWSTTGIVIRETGAPFAVAGNPLARLSSGNLAGAAISAASLETFLNLPANALHPFSGDTSLLGFNGSGLKQSINVTAPGTLKFKYRFLSSEDSDPSIALNDFALFHLFSVDTNSSVRLETLAKVSSTSQPSTPSVSGYSYDSGMINVSYFVTAPGNYSVGLGVLNVTDGDFSSELLVDDFQFQPSGNSAVPEPSSFLLLSAVGLGAGLIRRRVKGKRGAEG
jgi:hypothetical protein